MMDSIIGNRDLDGSDSSALATEKAEGEKIYGERAGVLSEKIASLDMTDIDEYDTTLEICAMVCHI